MNSVQVVLANKDLLGDILQFVLSKSTKNFLAFKLVCKLWRRVANERLQSVPWVNTKNWLRNFRDLPIEDILLFTGLKSITVCLEGEDNNQLFTKDIDHASKIQNQFTKLKILLFPGLPVFENFSPNLNPLQSFIQQSCFQKLSTLHIAYSSAGPKTVLDLIFPLDISFLNLNKLSISFLHKFTGELIIVPSTLKILQLSQIPLKFTNDLMAISQCKLLHTLIINPRHHLDFPATSLHPFILDLRANSLLKKLVLEFPNEFHSQILMTAKQVEFTGCGYFHFEDADLASIFLTNLNHDDMKQGRGFVNKEFCHLVKRLNVIQIDSLEADEYYAFLIRNKFNNVSSLEVCYSYENWHQIYAIVMSIFTIKTTTIFGHICAEHVFKLVEIPHITTLNIYSFPSIQVDALAKFVLETRNVETYTIRVQTSHHYHQQGIGLIFPIKAWNYTRW